MIALSYFDNKIGPQVFLETEKLGEDVKLVLSQVFDQTPNEGFFWHSLANPWTTSLNYYFEVRSEWARGKKEMLMISLVFKDKLTSEKEHEVLSWVIDFIQKMKTNENVFKAFYKPSMEKTFDLEERHEIEKNYQDVGKWIDALHLSIKEEIRKRTDEEIIASLMVDEAIYQTVRKLSKYPVRIDELKAWFLSKSFLRFFDKIIEMLEEQKFIFINNIGHETYVLLVKDVKITRVPPLCALELFETGDLDDPLVCHYQATVANYFDNYNAAEDDKLKLYSFLARPRHYNVISELRNGPKTKVELAKLLRQGPVVASKLNVIGELKAANIIDEQEINGEHYVFLKCDISIRVEFPEYIERALPEKPKQVDPRTRLSMHRPQDELHDLFKDEAFEPEAGNEATHGSQGAGGGQVMHGEACDSGAINSLVESPFDLIFNEVSIKFSNQEKQDKKEPDQKEEQPT